MGFFSRWASVPDYFCKLNRATSYQDECCKYWTNQVLLSWACFRDYFCKLKRLASFQDEFCMNSNIEILEFYCLEKKLKGFFDYHKREAIPSARIYTRFR